MASWLNLPRRRASGTLSRSEFPKPKHSRLFPWLRGRITIWRWMKMAECGCGEEMTQDNLEKIPGPLGWLPTGLRSEYISSGAKVCGGWLCPFLGFETGRNSSWVWAEYTSGQTGQSSGTSYARLPTAISGFERDSVRLLQERTAPLLSIKQGSCEVGGITPMESYFWATPVPLTLLRFMVRRHRR